MEGIDIPVLNKEFGLTERGYTAFALVALGYGAKDDFNKPAQTPKSRLPEEAVFTMV